MNEEVENPVNAETREVLTDPGQAQDYIADILAELLAISHLTANKRLQFFLVEALTAAKVAQVQSDG